MVNLEHVNCYRLKVQQIYPKNIYGRVSSRVFEIGYLGKINFKAKINLVISSI